MGFAKLNEHNVKFGIRIITSKITNRFCDYIAWQCFQSTKNKNKE